jgi:hypothetical protein
MGFTLMDAEIKFTPANGPYFFRIHGQIYSLVLPLYPNEANKPGYEQVYIADSAEGTKYQLENQSNQGCMTEVKQGTDEIL